MPIKHRVLGLALALTTFVAAPALAQTAPDATAPPASTGPTVDDGVAQNNCAPRYQHRGADNSYDGCTAPRAPAGTPAQLMAGFGPGGQPLMVNAADQTPEALNRLIQANQQACQSIHNGARWHTIASVLRVALGVGEIFVSGGFGGRYQLLSGLNVGISELDHQVNEMDVRAWRRLTESYCALNGFYTNRYGPDLVPADSATH